MPTDLELENKPGTTPQEESLEATRDPSAITTEPPKYEDLIKVASPISDEPPKYEDLIKVASPISEEPETSGLGAAAEGAARGVFSEPLTTAAELGLSKLGVPNLSAEDISKREKEHPIESKGAETAGLIGSMFLPFGQGKLLAQAGTKAVELARLGNASTKALQLGAMALKGLVEFGGLSGGEAANKLMLGEGDPEHPVGSALAHTGAGMLFGAITNPLLGMAGMGASAGLKAVAKTQTAQKAEQWLADFGSQWGFNQENPNKVVSTFNELKSYFDSNHAAMDDVYDPKGIKAQAIAKLVPEINEPIKNQSQTIANSVQSALKRMTEDPESYSKILKQNITNDANEWMQTATDPKATSEEIFNASQRLKQKLGVYSKFGKSAQKFSKEENSMKLANELRGELEKHLENTEVWGKAGDLQKGINKAFSSFKDRHDQFLGQFGEKIDGEMQLAPKKLLTYLNEMKPDSRIPGELKENLKKVQVLKNYIKDAEKYRGAIGDAYGQIGLESPVESHPLSIIKSTWEELPPGAEAANALYGPGISKALSTVGSTLGGGAAAHALGDPSGGMIGGLVGYAASKKITSLLEDHLGRPIKAKLVPFVWKALSEGQPRALAEVLDHAENVLQGNEAMDSGVDALFMGSKLLGKHFISDDPEKVKKIKDFVEGGGLEKQINNTLKQQDRQKRIQAPIQRFAEGGEVKDLAPEIKTKGTIDGDGKLAQVFPDQAMLMSTAKGRVYNYLNAIRPQPNQIKLPFDEDHGNEEKKKSYEAALKIANKPLSVLPEIQKGTITPEHVKHLTQMWPEVYGQVTKKMNERLVKAQMSGEKPPYHIRQGMSMFLGAPLDSTMTPSVIQAAQATFVNKKAAQQQAQVPVKNKKGTSTLSDTSKHYETASQSAEYRRQTAQR